MATNGMTINGLNPLSALTADDKIPVWDTGASGEPTKEITAQNMANSVKSLASLPNTTEMNDAIEQSTASMPLIYKPTGTITTSNIGAFTLNTGISLSGKRAFVLSNYGVSNSTQYNFFVESFASSGAVNLRVRKIGDGTAVAETSIDLTKIALIIV